MTVSAAIKGARCTADLFAVPPVPTGGQRVLGAPVVSKQGRTSLPAWDLHVVVPYYNPFQWASRLRLHNEFMAWISGSGCQVYVVELTLGAHDHQVTQAGNPRHLQLRVDRAMPWVKENLINIGLRRLVPTGAEFVAWVDGDVRLENPHWATDTLHELQHAKVVQLFSECVDVGPSYQLLPQEGGAKDVFRVGFVKHFLEHGDPANPAADDYATAHCGFAWAARREFLAAIDPHDPLIDYSLVGSADWQMAWAFVGHAEYGCHGQMSDGYTRRVMQFGRKCDLHLRGDISYVPGLLRHHFHGRKKNRQYTGRWDLVTKEGFDPDYDLTYDREGIIMLTDRNPRLPLLLRAYGRNRDEDSIDTA